MDLTLFIVFIILIVVVYYLVMSIQSLISEIQEIKSKCIKCGNVSKEEFKVKTEDPGKKMKSKALSILKNLNYIISEDIQDK